MYREIMGQQNKLRPAQNGRHFEDGIFKCIFLHETFCILIENLLKFVQECLIGNMWVLVQVIDRRL